MTRCKRIERYAWRYFERYGRERWPTVREVAKSLRLKVREVHDAIDGTGENLDLACWRGCGEVPDGRWFVEIIEPPERTKS